jgi:protocatechuate 3,4-dioxygenase beta subunit
MVDKSARRALSRRELLKLGIGSAGALAAGMLGRTLSSPPPASAAAASPGCVVRPEQTEGPYFVDEKLNRSDIRIDPSDRSIRPGAPLRLEFQVSRVAGSACTPLADAMVDVWHCDALGVYSDVRDPRFDTRGKKFLRGYQITDAAGIAAFQTIYPGWYEGRAVHIHFKIRTSAGAGRVQEFTSQIYFDEAVNEEVFTQPPYAAKSGRRVANDADFLFRRGGKELLLRPVKGARGYAGVFAIGLRGA